MLRNIMGRVWRDDEPWEDKMKRTRSKVERALRIHPIEDWSAQLLHRLFVLLGGALQLHAQMLVDNMVGLL